MARGPWLHVIMRMAPGESCGGGGDGGGEQARGGVDRGRRRTPSRVSVSRWRASQPASVVTVTSTRRMNRSVRMASGRSGHAVGEQGLGAEGARRGEVLDDELGRMRVGDDLRQEPGVAAVGRGRRRRRAVGRRPRSTARTSTVPGAPCEAVASSSIEAIVAGASSPGSCGVSTMAVIRPSRVPKWYCAADLLRWPASRCTSRSETDESPRAAMSDSATSIICARAPVRCHPVRVRRVPYFVKGSGEAREICDDAAGSWVGLRCQTPWVG